MSRVPGADRQLSWSTRLVMRRALARLDADLDTREPIVFLGPAYRDFSWRNVLAGVRSEGRSSVRPGLIVLLVLLFGLGPVLGFRAFRRCW